MQNAIIYYSKTGMTEVKMDQLESILIWVILWGLKASGTEPKVEVAKKSLWHWSDN